MNILKPIHPIHIPEAFSKSKTKARSKDVCELSMGKIQRDHSRHGLEKSQETHVLLAPLVHPYSYPTSLFWLLNSSTMFAICM